MTLAYGSLFSGIGGLDLGLDRAGMTPLWQSEIDPFASQVLARHWPTTPNLGDITLIDWSTVERPDLICGGYPCQPFSYAGRRAGEHDPRHLWPHALEAIRVLRPRFALLENVPGHLSMGFGRVLGDLAEIGYDSEWDCIPAAAVGADHRRDRVFILAHASCKGLEGCGPGGAVGNACRARHLADPDGVACPPPIPQRVLTDAALRRSIDGAHRRNRASGGHWATEPGVGRVADGVPHRVDRLRALGNAVVPQVAELIGRRIVAADRLAVAS